MNNLTLMCLLILRFIILSGCFVFQEFVILSKDFFESPRAHSRLLAEESASIEKLP